MKLEELFFKVKKVKFKDAEFIGVITPVFKNTYFNSGISNSDFNLICLDGRIKQEININRVEVLTTRITDKEIKKLFDEISSIEKEKYQNFKQILKLKEEIKNKETINSALSEKTENKLKSIIKVRGFISESEFNEIMDKSLTLGKNSTVEFDIKSNTLKSIGYINEVDLGKYIKEEDYSFLYIEYDGHLMVYDDDNYLENCKDFKKIKEKNFKSPKKKVLKYNVEEDYSAETGDKNSASVYQTIDIKDINIELKKENINEILNIFRELFSQLNEVIAY